MQPFSSSNVRKWNTKLGRKDDVGYRRNKKQKIII